ncbi:MAG TPA: hypothetical protein DD473_23440 [Planctomycetaceae bacterium]|nr:hypothetical protein [Planctomycetaceae bacterium]
MFLVEIDQYIVQTGRINIAGLTSQSGIRRDRLPKQSFLLPRLSQELIMISTRPSDNDTPEVMDVRPIMVNGSWKGKKSADNGLKRLQTNPHDSFFNNWTDHGRSHQPPHRSLMDSIPGMVGEEFLLRSWKKLNYY